MQIEEPQRQQPRKHRRENDWIGGAVAGHEEDIEGQCPKEAEGEVTGDHPAAGLPEFVLDVALAVAIAHMAIFADAEVDAPLAPADQPQVLSLRNRGRGHDQMAAGTQSTKQVPQYGAIVLDVLQYIGVDDQVEFVLERQRFEVARVKLDVAQAEVLRGSPRNRCPILRKVDAGNSPLGYSRQEDRKISAARAGIQNADLRRGNPRDRICRIM